MPANLVKGNDNFILKVKGESMINAGILNKDYVIVDRSSYADNSQIVVALINGEHATVKTPFTTPIISTLFSFKISGYINSFSC